MITAGNTCVSVDTEAAFDSVLASGRNVHVRGEGNGGIVDLTTPKTVTTDRQRIVSDGHLLRFTMVQNPNGLPAEMNPRGLTVRANDVVIEDLEMISTQDLGVNSCYGIALAEGPEDLGHRLTLRRLHLCTTGHDALKDGSRHRSG
jgi:hypothetical protein